MADASLRVRIRNRLADNGAMPLDDVDDDKRDPARKQHASARSLSGNSFAERLARFRQRQNENPVRPGFYWAGLLVLAAFVLFDLVRRM